MIGISKNNKNKRRNYYIIFMAKQARCIIDFEKISISYPVIKEMKRFCTSNDKLP
jgi:hypothetical protein